MVYLFTAIPFLTAFLAAVMVIGWVGFTISRPAVPAFLLLAVLVAFTGSTYGQLDVERTIYSRGTGMLHFSIINYFLWGTGLVVALRNTFERVRPEATPLAKYFAAFTLLIIANAFVAGGSDDRSLHVIDAFSYSGLLNIINMAVFFYVIVNVFSSPGEARKLIRFLLIAIAIRGIFGMVRWALFGGDTANIYENVERTGTKLTFFDINDGFLATLASFCSAWLLSYRKQFLSKREQLAVWALMLLETAIIVLSFRRSSLVGMGLASALFVVLLPARQRLGAIVLSGSVLAGSVALLTALRLNKVRGADANRGFLFDILSDGKKAESGSRMLEFTETWRSLGDYWLFGKGMWGTMQSNLAELSYHAGNFGFVHSGFGHILLKGGLFGLFMFIGLLASFTLYYIQARRTLSGDLQMLADAGAAGVIFWLPTLLIGTPIIEFRSMMMLGLALALPFLAIRAAASEKCHAAT
jgi:hypothetical protein